MSYALYRKFYTLSSCTKHFENLLRFDKVTGSLKVGNFFRHSMVVIHYIYSQFKFSDGEHPNRVLIVLCTFSQTKRLQITCPKSERFGKPEIQSGWYVCVAEPFNLVKPCIVYSFG